MPEKTIMGNFVKKILFCILLIINILQISAQKAGDYSPVWTLPSHNSAGSMPLGNGESGANLWVEEDGGLLFYLSRTDAISEANRLMKLGRVRVSLSPNPFLKGKPFRQTLLLDEGAIEIEAGEADEKTVLRFFWDMDGNTAYLTCESRTKREIRATAESWRREEHTLAKNESTSSWTLHPLPDDLKITESADVFLPEKNAVAWMHANRGSQLYDLIMKHQDLESLKENFPDLVSGRIFGVYMSGESLSRLNDSVLCTKNPVNKAIIKITTHSAQVKSPEEWTRQIKINDARSQLNKALAGSRGWWKKYWERSYVYIDIPDNQDFAFRLTQSCILQRFMAAGSGRGNLPIKFNGSIFTADPVFTNEQYPLNPDYRNWGNDFWFQNTRLPYFSMLASGDFDLMKPFFRFYLDRLPAFRALAKKFYGAEGFFIPETATVFGTYSNGDYGWNREGVTPDKVTNEYIRHIWSQTPEMIKIMLDYCSKAGDTAFLRSTAVPFAREALEYFDSRFVAGKNNMRIEPTQSIETYWYNVANDLPCVAGLHCVTEALLNLPENAMSKSDRDFFSRIAGTLPEIPVQWTVEGDIFIPAERYLNIQRNVENPELYAVFPFDITGKSDSIREIGIRTYKRRIYSQNRGWGQDGQTAAMLGLTDDLPEMLKAKVANTNPNHRFPTMWGPNYDWTPDQDHGSNLLLTVQAMLLQNRNGKNLILPAWPKDWNVVFKLYAPNQTVVEGEYRDGKLEYNELKTDKK